MTFDDEEGGGDGEIFLKWQLKIEVMTCTVYRVIYIIYSKRESEAEWIEKRTIIAASASIADVS